MKNSGIEWIGAIPDHWEIAKIKNIALDMQSGGTPDSSNDSYYIENGMPWVTISDMSTVSEVTMTEKSISYEAIKSKNLKIFDEGTILYAMYASVGKISKLKIKATINQAILGITLDKNKCESDFFIYVLKAWENFIFSESNGTTQFNLNAKKVANLQIALPSISIQNNISTFLDSACTQIDALILNQERQIEKLKQYKQSLITEVVTKGLDPTVPLKDSGIKWIGKIAISFTLKRLKDLVYIMDNCRQPITADQRSQESEVLYDYYGASGVIDKIDGFTINDHVMLIGEDGANLRLRNLPLMYEVNGRAWINNHAHILKPRDNNSFDYLFFALEGLDLNPYITGSAQPKLSQENLKNIWIPVPNYEIQEQIGRYIRKKHEKVDKLIAIKQSKIEKLNQYKKSLIYEYVTGKKEVV